MYMFIFVDWSASTEWRSVEPLLKSKTHRNLIENEQSFIMSADTLELWTRHHRRLSLLQLTGMQRCSVKLWAVNMWYSELLQHAVPAETGPWAIHQLANALPNSGVYSCVCLSPGPPCTLLAPDASWYLCSTHFTREQDMACPKFPNKERYPSQPRKTCTHTHLHLYIQLESMALIGNLSVSLRSLVFGRHFHIHQRVKGLRRIQSCGL